MGWSPDSRRREEKAETEREEHRAIKENSQDESLDACRLAHEVELKPNCCRKLRQLKAAVRDVR